MFSFEVNAPYPNRIQWVLNDFVGPFIQTGPLGYFDPRRDLEVYVDGALTTINDYSFDAVNNRYLMFTKSPINLQGVIQIVHHMPTPPFLSMGGSIVPSFALLASYSTAGDFRPSPTAVLTAIPHLVTLAGTPITLTWNTTNIVQIEIIANNGIDPAIDSGLIDTNGVGVFFLPNGISTTTTFILKAYDTVGHLALTTTTQVVYSVYAFIDTATSGAAYLLQVSQDTLQTVAVPQGQLTGVTFMDTQTGQPYELQVTNGAFDLVTITTPVPYELFFDSTTNIVYQLQVSNGAIQLVPSIETGVGSLILIDTVTSSPYQLTVTNGVLTIVGTTGTGVSGLPFTDNVTGLTYLIEVVNGVLQLVSTSPPLASVGIVTLFFTDVVTDFGYQLHISGGALTVQPPITQVSYVVLTDSVTGTNYKLAVTNGATSLTTTTGNGYSSLPFTDAFTGLGYQLQVVNGALKVGTGVATSGEGTGYLFMDTATPNGFYQLQVVNGVVQASKF